MNTRTEDDAMTVNRFGDDNCLDMRTTYELTSEIRALATEALGRAQAAQSDRYLYDLLLDLNAGIGELIHRVQK